MLYSAPHFCRLNGDLMAPVIREVESMITARLWALFGESALALLWPLILPLCPSPRTAGGTTHPTPAPLPSASAVKESDHMLPFYVGIF
jgi:hypothetical protein